MRFELGGHIRRKAPCIDRLSTNGMYLGLRRKKGVTCRLFVPEPRNSAAHGRVTGG